MQKKILIVDDDINFVNKVIDSSFGNKISFSIADSLKRAEMLILNDSFDMVLANVKIPGGSSMDLRTIVKPGMQKTSFLFMSSLDSDFSFVNDQGEKCFHKYDFDNSIKAYLENV